MNQSTRAYYLDWIRIGVILLLVPFHSALTFGGHGDTFIRYPQQYVPTFDIGLWFLSTWIMPVLFVVSGIASYYALQHRTPDEYMRERRAKLLVPFIAGTLLVISFMSYLRALFIGSFHGNFLEFYPVFFSKGPYPRGNFTWGQLWFLAYLYVFTLILKPLFVRTIREGAGSRLAAASSILEKGLWIYLIVIPSMFTETLLRPFFPGLQNLFWDWANFTLYLVLVFYGFVFAMNDRILDNIERIRMFSLLLGTFLFVLAASLKLSGIEGAIFRVYPAYNTVMVFAWVFTVAAYFIARSDLNMWLRWLIVVAFSYPSTFALYEIVRRIPVLRFLFGVKPGQARIIQL